MSIMQIGTSYIIAEACYRCEGKGHIAAYAFIFDGQCFACGGSKITRRTKKNFETAEAARAYEAKLDARLEAAEAKRQKAWAAGQAERDARNARIEAERAAAEAARLAENATYRHLDAAIGEQVTITGIIKTAVSIDGNYGQQMLIVIETADRELVKTYTAANWAFNVERNETITITAEVSGFSEYEGKPQTQVRKPKTARA